MLIHASGQRNLPSSPSRASPCEYHLRCSNLQDEPCGIDGHSPSTHNQLAEGPRPMQQEASCKVTLGKRYRTARAEEQS